MEVIKPGRPQKGWSKNFKCTGKGNNGGGCGAILLVSEYDIYQTESHALNETDYYTTFCCCQCGVETDIEVYGVNPGGKRPSEKERRAIAEKTKNRNKEGV